MLRHLAGLPRVARAGALLLAGALGAATSPATAAGPSLTPLLQFNGADGWNMTGHIVAYDRGILGTTGGDSNAVLLLPPATAHGSWTSTVLHQFNGQNGDGEYPQAGVALAGGLVFGSTSGGGNSACGHGCGTVFQLTPPATSGGAWSETLLASFAMDNNGYGPSDTVLPHGAATLYGTTLQAANDTVHPGGSTPVGGLVFQLTKPASGTGPWTETVLYHFNAAAEDGDTPYGGLTLGAHGVLYGTTFTGGICNQGTVYSLTPPAKKGGAWTETRLHDFGNVGSGACDYDDGENPVAALTLVGSTLFGTTRAGGNGGGGCGTAFAITPGTPVSYQFLYAFGQTSADGCSPATPVRVNSAGDIYGTTSLGGGAPSTAECSYGCGTLYELVKQANGTYVNTILYAFQGGLDGSSPNTNLLGTLGGTLKGAAAHGGFATDTGEPNYESFGTLFQYRP
jgi:uncharacterized repeat protein (TIGR03803 family)